MATTTVTRTLPVRWSGWSAAWWRLVGGWSLARKYFLANLLIVLVGMLAVGAWISGQVEESILNRTAAVTALYVESFVEPQLQPMRDRAWVTPAEVAELDRLLADTPLGERIVAFKVWAPTGMIAYSPNRALIRQTFPIDDSLGRALKGEVVATMTDLTGAENVYERQHWSRLMEVYVPMRATNGSDVIAVTEFYSLADDIQGELNAARLRAWLGVAAIAAVSYLLLAGLVQRASNTIDRQQMALRDQVGRLSRLLEQNARLGERVRQAAARTTTLNEQALQRISADLHDGPGQALALALLRLDSLGESITPEPERASTLTQAPARTDFAVVQGAVHDALDEIRAISAGLRSPELAPLTVRETAERAIRDHERRTGIQVALGVDPLPHDVSLALKVALFRSLQESLSNATRHGQGKSVSVHIRLDEDRLCLRVCDAGPGFAPDESRLRQGLGLTGMRERAELLGGSFAIRSEPGVGTQVELCWPLDTGANA